MPYDSIEQLISLATERGTTISALVLEDQAKSLESDTESVYARMEESFDIMCGSVSQGMDKEQRSMSGLTGGEGYRMQSYLREGKESISGPFLTGAMARALAVAGHNAAMGRIVAAPTAGSCGILPGCLVSFYEEKRAEKRAIVMSLFTAGAFGMVVANKATLAGAEGGCQAECGAAAGMAAAALTEIMGGTPAQCGDALAIAIVNQMGLVCDPVGGLVEIPCIKRNAAGCAIACAAADMALAHVNALIPPDECIDAMRAVGSALPASLRETGEGGLAATPTGKRLKERVFGP